MKIATLLTCHNRKIKTTRCIFSLLNTLSVYNLEHNNSVNLEIFLTDDGCSDGTAEAVRDIVGNKLPLHILKGDGNLFWAGGMRFCWSEALKRHTEWDYYLLLNDDVEMMDNLFDEILSAQAYNREHYGLEGLCSGNTCWRDNPNKRSYGGRVWVSRFWATHKPLEPTGEPQMCDLVNANILLVPNSVVGKIGIFYKGYQHGNADYDYGIMARKAGFPVVVTGHFCGIADNDHRLPEDLSQKIKNMNRRERKEYFSHPLRSSHDYLCFIRRATPLRYPLAWIGDKLRLEFPQTYYKLNEMRNWK